MREAKRLLVVLLGLAAARASAGGPAKKPQPPHRPVPHRPVSAVVSRKAKTDVPARPRPPTRPPELLFTFDDGPHLERTPKVLKILDEHHIKAVFFVNGVHFKGKSAAAEKARAILREVLAHGHAIGNHTINHLFLCGVRGPKVAADEIEGNARLIEEATGHRPELYRTPYGAHCKTLSETLARLGVKHIGWDIDPQDWKVQNTVKVRDYIEHWLHDMKSGRQILLMHDIHQDSVEALPQILDWLPKENEERRKRGVPEIRIIDYAYLLPPHPPIPPLLEGLGRILIGQLGGQPAERIRDFLDGTPPRS